MITLDSSFQENQRKRHRREEDHVIVTGLHSVKPNIESEISSKGLSVVQLTEDEEKEIGNLGWKPYKDYFQVSKGFLLLTLVVSTQFVFVGLQTLSTYWMAFSIQMNHISNNLLVGVYAVISVLSCICAHVRTLMAADLGLKASRSFFTVLMDSVFKAPMSFFDSTPVGRILTRVSIHSQLYDT